MNDKKGELRRKLMDLRLSMSLDEVHTKSSIIIEKVIALVDWKSIKGVHIYRPIKSQNEVNTLPLINWITENYPTIKITSSKPAKNQLIPDDIFDLIIVPVLAYDDQKFRLGYGGGWYDKFLAKQSKAQTIGLAYSRTYITNLPHEVHDIPLSLIATDMGVVT